LPRRQQLGMVQGARGEARSAIEADEGHRQRRELAEEGEVVSATRAPWRSGPKTHLDHQLTPARNDALVVVERRLSCDQLHGAATAVCLRNALHRLLNQLPQRGAVLRAVRAQ